MEPDDICALENATAKVRKHPHLLQKPELDFFKVFLVGLGAKLPGRVHAATVALDEGDAASGHASLPPAQKVMETLDCLDSDDEDPEHLIEEAEPLAPLPASILEGEPSGVQMEACKAPRAAAAAALDAGDVDGAITKLTEALLTGGASALVFARRGELLLKQRRPLAAIQDCTVALRMSPQCGKALRIRGIARRRLGRWEDAHSDLALGQKLDFDAGAAEALRYASKKLELQHLEDRRKEQAARAAAQESRDPREQDTPPGSSARKRRKENAEQ